MDDVISNVKSLIEQSMQIYDDALLVYEPITNDLCARKASEDEVEHTLDRMLDFCSDEKMLLLFKKICRKYCRIYPEMIAWEINSYRQLWDSE